MFPFDNHGKKWVAKMTAFKIKEHGLQNIPFPLRCIQHYGSKWLEY